MTTTEVEGAAQLDASLGRFADDLGHLDGAAAKAGRIVQDRASQGAPKDTGALAQSIQATASGDAVAVGSPLKYAAPMEYGVPGHNIAAQPYLRPALADSTSEVLAVYQDEVQADLAKVKGA